VSSRIRIGVALVVGVVIIGGAFYLRGQTEVLPTGILSVSGSPTRGSIAETDKNNNGINDWEESLQTLTINSASKTGTAIAAGGDYEPKTLTDRFAQKFFEEYTTSDASGSSDPAAQQAFLNSSIAQLSGEALDTPYTQKDIRIGDSSPQALRDYGNNISDIVNRYSGASTENELTVFARVIDNDNAKDYQTLTNISTAYSKVLADTLVLAVPPELASSHLLLVNAYLAVQADVAAMANAKTDPLYALVRVKRYEEDAKALYAVFNTIYSYLYSSGVRYASDEPGSIFQVAGN